MDGDALARGRRRATDDDEARHGPLPTSTTALLGAWSGLVATAVMTVFRMPLSRSPPPTAYFWARFVGHGEPADHGAVGLLLHLAYGTAAGGLFGVLFTAPTTGSALERERTGVVLGVVYAMALSVFGERVLLRGLLDMDPDADERFVFHLSHLVYGLTLGAWVGSRAG